MDLMTTCSLIGKTLTPMAEDMTLSYVTAVVITGLTVVFLGLIILILFVWAFGKIFSRKRSLLSRKSLLKRQSRLPRRFRYQRQTIIRTK